MTGNKAYKRERETERERIGEGERDNGMSHLEKMAWVILTVGLIQLGII
jgi:hypothetical protein